MSSLNLIYQKDYKNSIKITAPVYEKQTRVFYTSPMNLHELLL